MEYDERMNYGTVDIEKILEADDEIFETFQKYATTLFLTNFAKQFKNTLLITVMFDMSCSFLKSSIFDAVQNDGLFGAKVMFRSLIEHYFRFQYLANEWMRTNLDDNAELYIKFALAREDMDTIRASVSSFKMYYPNIEIPTWSELMLSVDSLKDIDKNKIDQESRKYSLKSILRYMSEEILKNESGKELSIIDSLLHEYAALSSYTHGGIGAHFESLNLGNHDKRLKEYERIAGLTFHMANSVKLFSTLMYYQTDKEPFGEYYNSINKTLKKSIKNSPNIAATSTGLGRLRGCTRSAQIKK